MMGPISNGLRVIMAGLLDIRPNFRLSGELRSRHDITKCTLLADYNVDDEVDLMRKRTQPFFVPGRKYLLADEATQPASTSSTASPSKRRDPYLGAVGKDIAEGDVALSERDQAKFQSFQYISPTCQQLLGNR